MKPGITGPWQVSGRNDLSEEESQQLDVSYVQNWLVLGGHRVHSPYYRHGPAPQWCILSLERRITRPSMSTPSGIPDCNARFRVDLI